MAFLNLQLSGKRLYVFEITSFRDINKKPCNKKRRVGIISLETSKAVFDDFYLDEVEKGIAPISKEVVNDFLIKDFSEIIHKKGLNKPTKIRKNNNTNIKDNGDVFDSIKNWGVKYFILLLAKKIGLLPILLLVFGKNITNKILILASYLITNNRPLYYLSRWLDKTDFIINKCFNSQRISYFLSQISFNKRTEFYKQWCAKFKNLDYIALDITSISTYSSKIPEAKKGYNRDRDKIPQINLCMLVAQNEQLPIYQTIFQGNINDVKTLYTTINELEAITGSTDFIVVMDKGFLSQENIDFIYNNKSGKGFLIGLSFTNNIALNLINEINNFYDNPNYLITSKNDCIYGITKKILYGTLKIELYAHIYFNQSKYIKDKESLCKEIEFVKNKIQQKDVLTIHERKIAEDYLIINVKEDIFNIKINDILFHKQLSTSGWHILLSDYISDTKQANDIYKNKDVVEKSFNNLKNKLSMKRLRVHNSNRMENKLFIAFISLILISEIYKCVKNSDLYKKYTLDDIFIEIWKLKKMSINSKLIYKPISKEIKDIFKACDIPLPSNDEIKKLMNNNFFDNF